MNHNDEDDDDDHCCNVHKNCNGQDHGYGYDRV